MENRHDIREVDKRFQQRLASAATQGRRAAAAAFRGVWYATAGLARGLAAVLKLIGLGTAAAARGLQWAGRRLDAFGAWARSRSQRRPAWAEIPRDDTIEIFDLSAPEVIASTPPPPPPPLPARQAAGATPR